MKKIVCFVAGHSGGHITPSLTRAQQMLNEKTADEILFFSTTASLDKAIVTKNSAISKLVLLHVRAVPYTKKLLLPLFLMQLCFAFCLSLFHLIKKRPSTIISMGGYVSIPVCIAGWLLRIPIELYELNIEPGKAIKFLTPLAQKIWILHPETAVYLPEQKCNITEYPVRFSTVDRSLSREQALSLLNLLPSRKTIFVIGGSQGSLFLNSLIKAWLIQHSPELHTHIQIIHQTGSYDSTDWKKFYEQLSIPAIIFQYHEQLAHFYQAADLVISRAGAGTLAELAFFKKKSLIIPLETTTTRHQKYNAQAFARTYYKLFCVMSQNNLDEPVLFKKIDQLLALEQ